MRSLRFLAALVVAVVTQVLATHWFAGFPRAFDLFLVVAVSVGLSGDLLLAVVAGLVAGLTADALTGGLYGLYGFADTIIAYAAALVAQRLVIERAVSVWLIFVLAAALQQGIVVGLVLLLLRQPELPRWPWLLAKLATTGVLGVLTFALAYAMSGRVESWRRNRTRRIRFER